MEHAGLAGRQNGGGMIVRVRARARKDKNDGEDKDSQRLASSC